jgi:hypothetical protein
MTVCDCCDDAIKKDSFWAGVVIVVVVALAPDSHRVNTGREPGGAPTTTTYFIFVGALDLPLKLPNISLLPRGSSHRP